jgi:flavin reductase (DIM6/NTAB) family NADH-FMN oxidoreductase RutF
MFYEPKKGHPFKADPFNALVFPRPIGWISSSSKKGIANLAPYSFFNAVAYLPPQVMFAATAYHNQGGLKDSIANILATKEFVVNLATKKLRRQVVQSSIDAPNDVDEFKLMKLKKRKSRMVKPPSVAESPVSLECRLLKKIDLKTTSTNKNQNKMIIGEVVGIHIDDKFIKNNKINSLAMRAISRMGYTEYSEVDSRFLMERPKWEC